MPSKLNVTDASPEERSAWEVTINGQRVQEVAHIEIERPEFGRLRWGKRSDFAGNPDSTQRVGWAWQEHGGGGVITIPYAYTPDNEILVGLIEENRANMGGPRFCGIGGFQQLDISKADTQVNEAGEEAEINTRDAHAIGKPQVSNRLYFEADPDAGEGVQTFGLEVPYDQISSDGKISNGAEGKLGKAEFYEWKMAVLEVCGDALGTAAIAQVVAHAQIELQRRLSEVKS